MRALSMRHDDPQAASRPYDKARDGFVLGEGAGVVVLETAAHAAARGARVYAELAGAGLSSDAHHVAAPEPSGAGAARAIGLAVRDAGAVPAEVGTSTRTPRRRRSVTSRRPPPCAPRSATPPAPSP